MLVKIFLKTQNKKPTLTWNLRWWWQRNHQHEHHIALTSQLQMLMNCCNTSHCHHQSETIYLRTCRRMGRVSITPGKREEFRCMYNKFNSIIIVSFSVTNSSGLIMIRLKSYTTGLLLYKVCYFFACEKYFEHSTKEPLIVVIDAWKAVIFSFRRPIAAPLTLNYLCLQLTGRCVVLSSWTVMCRFLSFTCLWKEKKLDISLSCYISGKLATNMRNII